MIASGISSKIVGVLNVTPDSFSDGGEFLDPAKAHARALAMQGAGADVIEVGGDSSRPGSICTGPAEEWRRIAPVLSLLGGKSGAEISVDTHHAEVAAKAIAAGADYINDISGGGDPEMFPLVASHPVQLILMYSRCPSPHQFPSAPHGDTVLRIIEWLSARRAAAIAAGVAAERIILDPGMGAFIHEDPSVSWDLISRFGELAVLGAPLMLGASRKGFLKTAGENGPADRDGISALVAVRVRDLLAASGRYRSPLFIRAHNVELHREHLRSARIL
jgi:dihydropteroate synthase